MITLFSLLTGLILMPFLVFSEASGWPQWRGVHRDGKSSSHLKINWMEEGPKLAWESNAIPSQDDGGFGSVISDGQRVYVALVWHRDEPTETRTMNDLFLRKFGARKVNLPSELIEKAERDRLSLSPRLRGSKLDDWIEKWISENLDQKQKMTQGSLLASRFKKGKLALDLSVVNQLFSVKNKVFQNQQALDDWLNEQPFPPEVRQNISQSVPHTQKVAEDVVVALDLKSGTTLWQASLPGTPSGRKSSSTPCLKDGKLYAVGSKRIFCVDLTQGKVDWETPLEMEGIASSLMCHDDMIIVLAGNLRAYDLSSGKLVWENKQVTGQAASPVLWEKPKGGLIACNGRTEVFLVDPKSGKTFWQGPGGGSSTPVCDKDWMLVHGKDEKVGLVAYRWADSAVTEAWRFPKLTRRADSSPLIHDGFAYLIGAGMRACLDLESGKMIKKEMAKHDISSPILAGGKILAYEINGSFLKLIETNPEKFGEMNRFKIGALRCTSPSLVGTKLLIRKTDRIVCYDLSKSSKSQP